MESFPNLDPQPHEYRESARVMFGVGMFSIAAGVAAYFYFTHLEQQGGRWAAPAVIVLLYKLLGKWGIIGLAELSGLISLHWGWREWVKSREQKHDGK